MKNKASFEKDLSLNSLIILGAHLLGKKEFSFELLVKRCFDLFPDSFSLGSYPWPDSRKLDRPVRHLKNRGFLKAAPGNMIRLTPKGLAKAKEIEMISNQRKLRL